MRISNRGGGSLANQGVHTVDVLQWLGGPVVEVYGKFGVFAHEIESEDKTVAVLTFASGALGTLTTTTAAYPGLDRSIFVHGTRGSIVAEDDKLTRWRIMAETPDAEQEEEQKMLRQFGMHRSFQHRLDKLLQQPMLADDVFRLFVVLQQLVD